MSYSRNQWEDSSATQQHLENALLRHPLPYSGDDGQGRSWLGHCKGSRMLDIHLLKGSSMEQLMSISGKSRAGVIAHFKHLRREHGLEIELTDGIFRLKVLDRLPLQDFVYRMVQGHA